MFFGDRLRQVRELLRLTQTELAARVRKSQAAIANIEAGLLEPSPELAEIIADKTRFPISFFANEPRFQFPIESLMFRARATTTRREAISASRYAEIILELVELLERSVNTIPPILQKSSQSPEMAAQQVRRLMGIASDEPILHLTNAVERIGVVVLALPIDLTRVDAFSALLSSEQKRPIIATCCNKPGDRLRFSVAHELGHLTLHPDRKQLRAEEHREADRFAAELLMPEAAIRQEVAPPVTLSRVAQLKPRWGVSIQALIRRSHDIRIISNRQYRYLFEQLSAKGWRMREPENLDIPAEKPRGLRKMAELLYGVPIDYVRLASDARLSVSVVREILEGYSEAPSVFHEGQASSKVIPLRAL